MNQTATLAAPAIVQRLDRRHVYIFPTRHGFTLGVMLVVILLGAINYDNALGYLLAFLLGGLFLVAMLHTYRNLAGLQFAGVRCSPVFVGEIAQFECHIDNESERIRLSIALSQCPRRMSREARRYLERFETRFNLDPSEQGNPVVPVEALRRGWLALGRIRLRSVFPLGILRAWAYFDTGARCLAYPAPHGTLPLPRYLGAASGTGAATQSGSDDFAGLRPYTPGDPPRAIAWKTLAKEQDLMIKRFEGSASTQVWLSWDAVGSLANVEARLSQLTQWTLEASRAAMTFGLEIPGVRIEFGHGMGHRDQCLRALALFEADR